MTDQTRGLLDTSVVIDHDVIDPARLADLLVASTAAANSLPLYTRNPRDFDALQGIIKVVAL